MYLYRGDGGCTGCSAIMKLKSKSFKIISIMICDNVNIWVRNAYNDIILFLCVENDDECHRMK